MDHGAGLAARHQSAVILVGAVCDANDRHPQAALRRRGGEFTVLRQDDQAAGPRGRRHPLRLRHSRPGWPPGCPAGRAGQGGRREPPW